MFLRGWCSSEDDVLLRGTFLWDVPPGCVCVWCSSEGRSSVRFRVWCSPQRCVPLIVPCLTPAWFVLLLLVLCSDPQFPFPVFVQDWPRSRAGHSWRRSSRCGPDLQRLIFQIIFVKCTDLWIYFSAESWNVTHTVKNVRDGAVQEHTAHASLLLKRVSSTSETLR